MKLNRLNNPCHPKSCQQCTQAETNNATDNENRDMQRASAVVYPRRLLTNENRLQVTNSVNRHRKYPANPDDTQ